MVQVSGYSKPEGKTAEMPNRISEKFSVLARNGEKALVAFITAGDPDLETTIELVLALEKAGADIIELGVPYSDPLADGPIIQQASRRALQAGATLKKIFDTVTVLRKRTQIPIILMTYYNPLLRFGLDNAALTALSAGVDGFIVPDLPPEESGVLQSSLAEKGIFLIPLVAPTSGRERIMKIAAGAQGFIYCVSLTGVTGVRQGIPDNLKEFMAVVRSCTEKPLAVGFGISTPEQVAEISRYCDAVIVGSAFVKTIGEKGNTPELIDTVSQMAGELKKPLSSAGPGDVSASGR